MATKAELQATIEALQRQVDEALLAFDDIKQGIINKGIEVADGTPVSEYKALIESIVSEPTEGEGGGSYEEGYQAAYDEYYQQRYDEGYSNGQSDCENNHQLITDDAYNNGYSAGQSDCESNNHNTIRQEGYDEGYLVGYQAAIDEGATGDSGTTATATFVTSFDEVNNTLTISEE